MTITERGWAGLGAALALLVLWALLGEVELAALGLLIAAAVFLGWLSIRGGIPDITVSRHLHPALVQEGDTVSVELIARNDARRPWRYITIDDEIRQLGEARFRIGSLAPRVTFFGAYEISCHTRGIYELGPTTVSRSDPFMFTKTSRRIGAIDRLIVYPRVERLSGLPTLRGVDPSMQAARSETVQRGGEDFFSLREYQTGDDLRRVHWPTTARRDEMMIRQFEAPWEPRALVVVDPRSAVYGSQEAFETAIRGAASTIHHFFSAGLEADLWTGGDLTSLDVNPYEAAMRVLAGLQPIPAFDFSSAATRLRLKGRGGTLVIVTGTPDPQVSSVTGHLTHHAGATVLLTVSSNPAPVSFGRGGAIIVSIRPGEAWATAWMKAMPWATAGVG
ncbi:MAG: DUF58 domain-containing protein [Actinobacteria bacterium]|nr:DUF58 domain-containing protein [Actinomycetota bacterium]